MYSIRDRQLRAVASPCVKGCACFACQHHSVGYVHHLVHAHEILGEVLLYAHNTAWMQGFMASLRRAISEGLLETYCDWFEAVNRAREPADEGTEEGEGGGEAA
jgi:tRNA-guanine family transglycosylase